MKHPHYGREHGHLSLIIMKFNFEDRDWWGQTNKNAYFEDRAAGGKATRWSVSLETITDGLMCDMVYSGHLQWPVNEVVRSG